MKLYENVMSSACHGLFYREGETLAEHLAELCVGPDDMLEYARKILVARGWVEDMVLKEHEVRVKGSIEVTQGSETKTCHRLRGILSRLYEKRYNEPVRFFEAECCSNGSSECIFKTEAD